MAYTRVANDHEETAKERAAATEQQSAAVSTAEPARVTYGDRTIEVPKIDHASLGRPVDKQYERNRASVETRMKMVGVHTATVVSFLPIPLISDSTLVPLKYPGCKIRPPKDHEPYVTKTFDEAHIEHQRMGVDSPLIAVDFHPITIAAEFSRVYPRGVFCFIGIPSDLSREDWRSRKSPEEQHSGRTYGEVFDETQAAAVEWMQDKLRSGNEDDRLKRNPSEPAKASARRLKALGMIKEMPNWVEKQRDVTQKIPMCPNCQRPCEPEAAQCTNTNCNYIIDPKRAYEINAIGEDHASLERLTREQVKKMGISDYVAETIDEKKDRLAVGGQKPLSVVALRLLESQDEVAAQRAREAAEALGTKIAEHNKGKGKKKETETEE